MAITNECKIKGLDNRALNIKVKTMMMTSKGDRNVFKQEIQNFREEYHDDTTEDFINKIYEGLFANQKILEKKGLWLSRSDLDTIFNGNNKPESEEIESKEEIISNDERYFQDISDHFIDSVYGTSTAKDKMIQSFKKNMIKSLFVDLENEKEIVTNKECNDNLIEYQEQLFADLKTGFPTELVNVESLFNESGVSNLPLINKLLDDQKQEFVINKLQRYSTNSLLKRKFNALNALFILNNFDRMLVRELPKMVQINKHEGVLSNDETKYSFSFKNSNINNTWRDDDKDIDGCEEVSDIIRRLFESMNKVNSNGDFIPDSYLTFPEIASVNTMIRSLAHHPKANIVIKDGKTLRQFLVEADNFPIKNLKRLYDVLVDKSFNPRNYGISNPQMAVIRAIHRNIFAENGSLYKTYLSMIAEVPSIDQQPKSYYEQVVQILNGQESIDMQEYSRTGGEMSNITLRGQQEITQTYSIDNTIGGIFNVNISDHKYTHFDSVELTNVNDINDEVEPQLSFKTRSGHVIFRQKGGIITIDGKKLTQFSTDELNEFIKSNRDFFREVTRFVYDDKFLELLEAREPNYGEQLIKMASSIIYNYEVSKQLLPYVGDAYNTNKDKYYNEDEAKKIKPYQHVKQLTVIGNEFTSFKISLAKTRDEYNGVTRTNVQKDADNKQISAIGLDQIATKPEQQWDRSIKEGTIKNESGQVIKKSPIAGFTALKLYRGQEFGRDFKGSTNKKATSFTEAENFIANFMFDYLGRIYPNESEDKKKNIIKLLPSVISDKSRIPKTLFDLNMDSEYVTDNGDSIKYIDLNTEDWQIMAIRELGDYYYGIYQDFENTMKLANIALLQIINDNPESTLGKVLINAGITSFDYDNNFTDFNTKLSTLYPDADERETVLKSILHEIALINKDTNYELIQNLHYNIYKGKLSGNAALYDQLYRWGKINMTHPSYVAYNLESGYGTAGEFFKAKQYQYVEDLLKDQCEILLHDSYGAEFKDAAYKQIPKEWKSSDNVIFAKINFNYITSEGIKNKELKITNKDSIKNSYIYKEIRKDAYYNPDIYPVEALDVNSQNFNLQKFQEAVKIYNSRALVPAIRKTVKINLSKHLKDANSDYKLESDIINNITKTIIEQVTSGREISITKDMLWENASSSDPMNVTKLLKGNIDKSLIKQFSPENVSQLSSDFEINPHLEKYQAIEFLLGQEYMNATLGTHLNHPGFGANLKEIEAASWGAQVKRNVSMTASKYRFALDSITGIKNTIRVAVIEDDKDIVYNIFGRIDKAKPFDGATLCSITSNYLENNSLGSNRAGIDKKQFIHDYKANSGSGIIVKTAGFPITNGRMRDSIMLQRLNKKMLNIKFPISVDITRDYNRDSLLWSEGTTSINKYGDMTYLEYDSKGNDILYKTVGIVYDRSKSLNGAWIYRQKYENGTWVRTDPMFVELDSNYQIWKHVFGGENSVTVHSDGSYEYNERSCEQLAYAMNYVGTKKEGVEVATSQSDVNQPLKEYVIDYVITEGAIKQGAANVNSRHAYFEDDFELATMKLNMYDAGIQLNAEHHADNSTLSLMTQVLNALSARGYSFKEGDEVYSALRDLTKEALKGFDLGQAHIKYGDNEEIQNFIADIILRSIRTIGSTDGNLIAAISTQIKEEYAKGNKVTYDLINKHMPISNPAIFKKMVSSIASVLTQRCIRIKFPGSMNVLAPSNKIYKLYADHLLSYYKGRINHLENISLKDESGKLQVGKIRMGRTYLLKGSTFGEKTQLIDDPREYWKVRNLVQNSEITEIEEVQKEGRDLSTYGAEFTDNSGKVYNLWDLDSIKYLYEQESEYRKQVLIFNSDISTNEQKENALNQIVKIANLVGYEGDPYDVKAFKNFLMQKLQQTLNSLKVGETVKADGFDIQIKTLDIQPYELIASKIYETTFGLKQGDDVNNISKDKLFFVRRMLENLSKKADHLNYDVELSVLNGKHVYLLHADSPVPSDLTEIRPEYQYEGDEVVQRDLSGKLVRKVSSTSDRIFVDSKGNEIIMTNNLNFYVDSIDFVQIGLSEHTPGDVLMSIFEQLVFSDKTAVKTMINNLFTNDDAVDILAGMEYSEMLAKLQELKEDLVSIVHTRAVKESQNIDELRRLLSISNPDVTQLTRISKTIANLVNKGLEIHTSFLQSLEFLAARIPAQSHQSFMAMKIVGFDESGKNTAYVSRMQIWLQGSDYDIDKVSLLGYKFKNGHFVKWSPHMDLQSKELLEASKQLPFPNNTTVQVSEGTEEQNNHLTELFKNYTNSKEHTVEYINAVNELIRYVNSLGFVPNITGSDVILKLVNSHNNYFKKGNIKNGLINFISAKMYQVSKDPKNLIQGQSPIDDMTKIVKDLGEKQPMNQKAKTFAPGSPQSKLSMLLLTLKGKENTGIVASAMKNFEACSQYYYKVLNSADPEQQKRLMMGVEIFGKRIRMLANAYTSDQSKLDEDVIEALKSVDNDTDAFLLFSAFLSLSTDNAKDPVLSKINAGPQMMGLYTAGLMMGFDVDALVEIMTSPVAWEMANMMNSNVFNDTEGIFNIDGIFNYIKNGPIKEYKALSKSLKESIRTAVWLYLRKSRPRSSGSLTIDKVTKNQIIATLKNPRFNLAKCLSDAYKEQGTEVDLETLEKSILENYEKDVIKTENYYKDKLVKVKEDLETLEKSNASKRTINSKKKELAKIQDKLTDLTSRKNAINDLKNNIESPDVNPDIRAEIEKYVVDTAAAEHYLEQISLGESFDFAEHDNIKMSRLYKAISKYHSFISLANSKSSTLIHPITEESYKAIDIIKQFSHIANEQSRLRPILGLNQELPNDLASQFKFLRNFENIFVQRAAELSPNNKAIKDFKEWNGDSLEIDFSRFITDSDYRDNIIKFYEPIKAAINIFDVMANSKHYFGYAEAANATIQSLMLASTTYRIANQVSKDVFSKYFNVSKNGKLHQKYLQRVQSFIANRINNQFLLSQDIVITIPAGSKLFTPEGHEFTSENETQILLGTPHGNAIFKYWMDNNVIPEMQSSRSANKFIRDLTKFSISKTFDGEGQVNYALTENMMPKSDYERAIFKQYKDNLNLLQNSNYQGIPKVDLFFYYNLIAYNGESSQNSFTSLFEDIFAEKSNDTVKKYIEFCSLFDKEGNFELGKDFTEDELLQHIAPVENLEQGKLKYIRVYDPDTLTIELFKLREDSEQDYENEDGDNPVLEEMQNAPDDIDFDPEEFRASNMTFEERVQTSNYDRIEKPSYPKYFSNGYYHMPERVSLSGNVSYNSKTKSFTIGNQELNYDQVVRIAKINGHGVESIEDIMINKVVRNLNGEPVYILDKKQTLSRIMQILEDYC